MLVVGGIVLAAAGFAALEYYRSGSGEWSEPAMSVKFEVADTKPAKPAPNVPKLTCFDDKQCLIDEAEALLKSMEAAGLQQDDYYSRRYSSSYGYAAQEFFKHTGNDTYLRRVLAKIEEEDRPHISNAERMREQFDLAAVLDDQTLIEGYLLKAKELLAAQPGQLRSGDLGIRPEWIFDASGTPDDSWLALTKGEYKVADLVSEYVRDGLTISVETGLERLRQYKPYINDYRDQLSAILDIVIADQRWPIWQQMFDNNPKFFDLLLDRVQGNDKEGPLLPKAYVPWDSLQKRILAAKSPNGLISDIYAYLRFAARDLSPQAFYDFLNTVTVLNKDKKEDYARYFVGQLIRYERFEAARKAITLFAFKADQQQRLTKKIAEAINPPKVFEERFTYTDYQDYVRKDDVHGPCQYLKGLVKDSSSYLMSSSHAYLGRKRIKARGAIFELFGADIEASCQQLEKPCDAVYFLHKLGHYSEQRPSIVKAMIQHIHAVDSSHTKVLSCNIYFLAGQLPFVNETKDKALFEDILSTIEQKLAHPMSMSGFRGQSDEYHLYARGIANSLFTALKQQNQPTIKRLLKLVDQDKLKSFFLENEFPSRLERAQSVEDFESTIKGILTLLDAFYTEQEARDQQAAALLFRLPHIDKAENFEAKMMALLNSFDDDLNDEARYHIINALLLSPNTAEQAASQAWLDSLIQKILTLKLNKIQQEIKQYEKAERYEYIEQQYGALQQALAGHKKPYSIETMLAALQHYRRGLNQQVPADTLLIKLLEKVLDSKNNAAIKRIMPLFQSSPVVLNQYITSAMNRALQPKTGMPDSLHAFTLYLLKTTPQPLYASNPQGNTPAQSLSTEGMTLKEMLATKPSDLNLNRLFCQLTQQGFTYEAEQLLLAQPDLYGSVGNQNQLCGLNLALLLKSQPMVERLYTMITPAGLIADLLARSAELGNP